MKRISTLILFCTLFSVFSYSQVSTDTIVKTISLSNIEVTGIRHNLLTPISQKIITSLDILKNFYGQEMTYVLETTPSVTTQSDGGQPHGYTYFKLRGIDQTRINVTLNGVPLNESEDLGAYYSNYPNFSTNIKSIQVQRGVGTLSNGTASFGGSINFESKDGLEKEGNLGTSIGSFNTRSTYVNYGTGLLKNNTAFYGGVSYYSSDGYRYDSDGDGISGMFSGGYFGRNDVIKLTTFTGKSKNQMAWLPTPDSLIHKDRRTNILSDREKDSFNQSMVQLQYTHSFDNNSILTSMLYYNNLNGIYGVMLDSIVLGSEWYNVNPTKDVDLFNYNLHSNLFGGFVNYKVIFNKFNINTGVHMNTYNRRHIGKSDVDTLSYNNIGYKNEISGYVNTKYKIGNFILFGDVQVRYTEFKYNDIINKVTNNIDILKLNWTFPNFVGGVTYKISDRQHLYTSVGLTHREPTRVDMFGDELYSGGLIITTPESVIDYELGYNFNKNKLELNTNLYFMQFKNQYLPTGQLNNSGLMIMDTYDKTYRVGVEFDGKYEITKWLITRNFSSLSKSNRYVGDQKHILYSPNLIINQDLIIKFNYFYSVLSGKYISKTHINLNDKNDICDDYFTLNTKLGFKIKGFDISLNIINTTNTKYYTSGSVSEDGTKNYFVGVPIIFYTTIKITI